MALREIKKYQKSIELLMAKAPMSCLVCKIMDKYTDRVTRIQGQALMALQEASKVLLSLIFLDIVYCMVHAKPITIQVKDMALAIRLREHRCLKF